ncbi:MAG: hypothetical protein ACXW3U_10135, partial [Rhodoplanes sp.]
SPALFGRLTKHRRLTLGICRASLARYRHLFDFGVGQVGKGADGAHPILYVAPFMVVKEAVHRIQVGVPWSHLGARHQHRFKNIMPTLSCITRSNS